jgi:PAS domain S-box-containing protein
MLHDITPRKQAEAELRRSETRYRQIFERNPAIQLLIDPANGAIIDANPAAAAYYGYSRADLRASRITDLDALPSEHVLATMQQASSGRLTYFEFEHQLADGTRRTVAMHVGPVEIEGRTLLYSIVTDITGQRQVENALRTNVRFLNTLIDTIPSPIFHQDRDGRFQGCNTRFAAEVMGLPKDRIIGRTICDLLDAREEAEAYQQHNQVLLAEPGTRVYEMQVRCADGQPHDFLIKKATVIDTAGQVAGIVGVMVDITERKRAEAEREQLIVDLNAFAHTVAHDLKTPLGVIVGFAALINDDFDTMPDDEKREHLHRIETDAQKMGRIVDELLLLSSLRESESVSVGPLDMDHIVGEALQRLDYLVRQCQAEVVLPEDGWPVAVGYAAWVEEIWANYLSNAIKYGGVPPRVELGADAAHNGMVRFWVRDNGPGIPPEDQPRLFNAFARLDQARAQGHGLGLSIVHRIVTRLGGVVTVETAPDGGSIFGFTLPRAPS